MSAREKTKTLYSRNGIRIIKTENVRNNIGWGVDEVHREERLENVVVYRSYDRGEWIEQKCQSPLGFYYYKRIWETHDNEKPKSATYKKYIICLGTEKFELEYPTSYYSNGNTQSIGIDMRPWDILPGYKGMPDNMINALVKEVNNFLNIILQYQKILKTKNIFAEIRRKIMCDLFGYEDGPKIQPNDIKILSHGFDLKQSFRKRKES